VGSFRAGALAASQVKASAAQSVPAANLVGSITSAPPLQLFGQRPQRRVSGGEIMRRERVPRLFERRGGPAGARRMTGPGLGSAKVLQDRLSLFQLLVRHIGMTSGDRGSGRVDMAAEFAAPDPLASSRRRRSRPGSLCGRGQGREDPAGGKQHQGTAGGDRLHGAWPPGDDARSDRGAVTPECRPGNGMQRMTPVRRRRRMPLFTTTERHRHHGV
jgi:hypothetical protein